jgi:hypothetical protein
MHGRKMRSVENKFIQERVIWAGSLKEVHNQDGWCDVELKMYAVAYGSKVRLSLHD